ncbi:hypothetical protein PG984_012125 [Apiospora sp. TS-2023a]
MLLGFDSLHRILVYWKAYQDAFPEEIGARGTDAVWMREFQGTLWSWKPRGPRYPYPKGFSVSKTTSR